MSLPTSIVDPVIEWTPHRQTRQGLILLPADSTTPVQDVAGPRCVEFYEDVRTPTYNRGVDDFVKDFALGQLGGTTANQPYKYRERSYLRYTTREILTSFCSRSLKLQLITITGNRLIE